MTNKKKKYIWRPHIFLRNITLMLLFLLLFSVMAVSYENVQNDRIKIIKVSAGDTLWKIAQNYYPNKDPRNVIQKLIKLNNLTGNYIYPGQKIKISD